MIPECVKIGIVGDFPHFNGVIRTEAENITVFA